LGDLKQEPSGGWQESRNPSSPDTIKGGERERRSKRSRSQTLQRGHGEAGATQLSCTGSKSNSSSALSQFNKETSSLRRGQLWEKNSRRGKGEPKGSGNSCRNDKLEERIYGKAGGLLRRQGAQQGEESQCAIPPRHNMNETSSLTRKRGRGQISRRVMKTSNQAFIPESKRLRGRGRLTKKAIGGKRRQDVCN